MANHAVIETAPHENAALERATAGPQRVMEFLRETRQEMRKVVVPTREEVRSNTIIVIATVFLFAAFFMLVDQTLGRLIDMGLLKLTGH